MVGRWIVFGMLLSSIPTLQLSAQVGHDPAHSPYRDIPLKAGPMLFAGQLTNDRGVAGAGPSDAQTFGIRYEFPTGRSLILGINVAYLKGDRFILDPRADATSPQRKTGPYPSDLLITDVGVLLRLTGAKSWRGFVPYAGFGLGLVYDLWSPGDTTFGGATSGYDFGTKFTLSGAAGLRWYPFAGRRLMLNADVRGQTWRLRYPTSFRVSSASDGSTVVPPDQETDWTLHPWVSFGFGWTF